MFYYVMLICLRILCYIWGQIHIWVMLTSVPRHWLKKLKDKILNKKDIFLSF